MSYVQFTEEQGEEFETAALAYIAALREHLGERGDATPEGVTALLASVATQGICRIAMEEGALSKATIAGMGEGLGVILGAIPDVEARREAVHLMLERLNAGLQIYAQLDSPEGSA